MTYSVAIVVEQSVSLLVNKAGEQLYGVPQLVEGDVGEGQHLELQLLEGADQSFAVISSRFQRRKLCSFLVFFLANNKGNFELWKTTLISRGFCNF